MSRPLHSTSTFSVHKSFAPLISKYDGFILDQFGVMHNGQNGLDGASECVNHLSTLGKKLIILSNTSSPSETALAKLPKLGFDKDHFLGAVTSGEEASHYIRMHYGNHDVGKKKRALWFTWPSSTIPSPRNFIDLCGSIELVDYDIDKSEGEIDVDFIITHGCGVIQGSTLESSIGDFMTSGNLDKVKPILNQCAKKKIPMVCANPDFIVVRPDGSKGHMPGKIARLYEELGGQCTYFGKPHIPHFNACLRDLGLPNNRVAHVGDSLHHDVAGANGAGIDSVFVAGGVHREELGTDLGIVPEEYALKKLFETHGQTPTHVVPMFNL